MTTRKKHNLETGIPRAASPKPKRIGRERTDRMDLATPSQKHTNVSKESNMCRLLGIPKWCIDYTSALQFVHDQSQRSSKRLLRRIQRFLSHAGQVDDEVLVELLLAMLPVSEAIVADLLNKQNSERDFHRHFLIFFTFAWPVHEIPLAVCPTARRFARDYLSQVDKDLECGPYMAADLLGDHWPSTRSGIVDLEWIIMNAHEIGRHWAIYGLDCIASRTKSKAILNRVEVCLRRVSTADRNHRVRNDAESTLKRLRSLVKP